MTINLELRVGRGVQVLELVIPNVELALPIGPLNEPLRQFASGTLQRS